MNNRDMWPIQLMLTVILIRHELNMSTVRPEPVEGLCFDRLSTNELADKSGRINIYPLVSINHLGL